MFAFPLGAVSLILNVNSARTPLLVLLGLRVSDQETAIGLAVIGPKDAPEKSFPSHILLSYCLCQLF